MAKLEKRHLGIDVYQASRERTEWVFKSFPRICVSFSGGKDSTVMLHIAAEVAREQGRKFALLFIDLEGQYKLTIDHIQHCYDLYADCIEPYWVCLPLHLRNAVSMAEPQWICWDKAREDDWIRRPPEIAITDKDFFPFFRHGMEFEEFVPRFGKWYADDMPCACLVGIRTDESLNRWRTIAGGRKQRMDGRCYTTWCGGSVFNIYPIYDWRTKDIWIYHAKTKTPYNRLYDRMHQAGLTIHQMRICQPYGDDQRKGLWLFHIIEPETWARVVARVAGANSGAMYAKDPGNILGNLKITKPEGHTWKSFAKMLIATLPPRTREHYENKITVFIRWWQDRGYPDGIPDVLDAKIEASKKAPSWRRICKVLLRNDYWCKGLSFSQHKSDAYKKYLKIMKLRRGKWNIKL